MCETISAIIANGHGYATEDGDVWFQVDTLPGYGALSGRSPEDSRWDRGGGNVDGEAGRRRQAIHKQVGQGQGECQAGGRTAGCT